MPGPLQRWLYIPSAVRSEITRFSECSLASFAGGFACWQRTLPPAMEIVDEIASRSRIRIGPNQMLMNQRVELLGKKAARATKGRPGPLLAELQRAVIGADVGFKGYLRVRGVGYRFQIESPGKSLPPVGVVSSGPSIAAADAAVPKLHIAAGLSHPLVVPLNPEFQTSLTRKFRMIRFRSKGLNSLTQTLASIRSLRPPDVYLGKGIRYRVDQQRQKEGKKKKA